MTTTRTADDILAQLQRAYDVVKAKTPRTLQRDDDLTEDLDIDSLDFIDLVSVLEDEYSADELDGVIDQIPDLVTVGDLIDAFLALAPSH